MPADGIVGKVLTVDVQPDAVVDDTSNSALSEPAYALLADRLVPSFTLSVQWDNSLALQWKPAAHQQTRYRPPGAESALDPQCSAEPDAAVVMVPSTPV